MYYTQTMIINTYLISKIAGGNLIIPTKPKHCVCSSRAMAFCSPALSRRNSTACLSSSLFLFFILPSFLPPFFPVFFLFCFPLKKICGIIESNHICAVQVQYSYRSLQVQSRCRATSLINLLYRIIYNL